MNRLFWGLFFLILDVFLELGTANFELLPDFIGLFLMMKGMTELAEEGKAFDRGRHLAFGLSIFSGILYVAELMDLESMARVGLWAAELAALVGHLVLVGLVVRGIRRMEKEHTRQLRGEHLKMLLMILAVLSVLSHLLTWLPLIGNICWVGELMAGLLFLGVFWDTRKRYLAQIA